MIVQRQPADRPGPNIIDAVLVTGAAQTERGRQEINENGTDKFNISIDTVNPSFILPGKLLSFERNGETVRGKVTSFSISVSESSVNFESNVSVECEA